MGIDIIGGGLAPSKIFKTDVIRATSAWICPADVTTAEVTVIAGGGGGAMRGVHYGATGGNGSALQDWLTLTPGASYTVTIGAGGAGAPPGAGGSGNNASAGGTSSFAALLVAPGGNGGSYSAGLSIGVGSGKGLGGFSSGGGQHIYAGSYGLAWVTNPESGVLGLAGGGGSILIPTGMPGVGGGGNIGEAGLANTGGGGGANYTDAGLPGGSGVVFIKYWSAL